MHLYISNSMHIVRPGRPAGRKQSFGWVVPGMLSFSRPHAMHTSVDLCAVLEHSHQKRQEGTLLFIRLALFYLCAIHSNACMHPLPLIHIADCWYPQPLLLMVLIIVLLLHIFTERSHPHTALCLCVNPESSNEGPRSWWMYDSAFICLLQTDVAG